MSEDIELQEVVIDGVIVKMRRDNVRGHIVGRMLNRRKGMDFLSVGQHHDTARMLACGTAHAHTALHDPVDLTVPLVLASFLVIILHITEGRLVRQRADGSGPEGLSLSENHLGVFMGLGLIITGKVQVDIRLLVSLESQEGLKRDVKAFLFQRRPADRAGLVRHVTAGCSRIFPHFLRLKVAVMAGRAVIMGRQGIDLCDSGHGRHKGGTYGTTGTHQITVIIGFPYQLLGNNIHNRESIGDNGMKLLLQTRGYHLRKLFSVNGVGLFITDITQGLIRIFDDRRTLIRANRRNPLNHIRDLICISDHDLPGLVASQVFKFRQHLLRRAKVEGRLIVRILKALSGHDDPAVHLVLRIQEMHVAGGHHRLVKLLAKRNDLFVQPDQIILGFKSGTLSPQHELIVSQRLNLQIIIEIHQPRNLFLRRGTHQSLIELSGLAGGTDDQSLPVLLKNAFRDSGHSRKIIQMGPGNHAVKVHPSNLVFRQNNHMVAWQLLDGLLIQGAHLVYAVQIRDIPVFQHLHELYENLCRTACIVHGPVMVLQRNIQGFRHRIQLIAVQLRQQHTSQGHRIHHRKGAGKPLALAVLPDKAHVKAGIVCHHDGSLAELQKPGQNLLNRGLSHDHLVIDAGQLLDFKRNRRLRIHKNAEFIRDLAFFHTDGSDLDNPVILRTEACGLNIKDHVRVIQALSSGVLHDILHIVYQIALQAVDHLKRISLIQTVAGIRIRLHHAVIRHGNGLMSPGLCPFDDILHVGDAVHIAHFRVAVKLHSFHLAVVHPGGTEIGGLLDACDRAYGQLIVKPVLGRQSLNAHKRSFFDFFLQICKLLRVPCEKLHPDGIRVIRHGERDNRPSSPDFPLVPSCDLSMDYDLAHLTHQLHQI